LYACAQYRSKCNLFNIIFRKRVKQNQETIMEENVVNTNYSPSPSTLEPEHEATPSNEASSKEAGGWRSVKYIIGIYVFYIN